MSEADIDKLAGILYEAYEGKYGGTPWAEHKAEYPILVGCWIRVAEAAVGAIVTIRSPL